MKLNQRDSSDFVDSDCFPPVITVFTFVHMVAQCYLAVRGLIVGLNHADSGALLWYSQKKRLCMTMIKTDMIKERRKKKYNPNRKKKKNPSLVRSPNAQ